VNPPKTFEHMVTCPKPNSQARLRLFCFPFAGAGPWTFTSWVDGLPSDIQLETELCSVQFPGRETNRRDHLLTRLPPLLEALTPVFQTYLNIPFAFFGHSMGALVSFELARQLRRQGLPGPVHMIVSGHRAPQLPDPNPAIHQLPDAEFLAKLRNLGGTPEEALQNPELMELFLPVLRADFAVCETYVYTAEEPLDCSITAFGGNCDYRVSREELSAWQAQSCKSFSLRMFPGDHFFLQSLRVPVLQVLAEDLKKLLRRLPKDCC
jgi:medium-chain acyl-[acyl-carrier-protein] hydrolase